MQATALAAPALIESAPMRAVIQSSYGSFDVLRVGTSARPRPSADEVVVRVHAAGVARGDWHMMTGRPYLMRVMGFGAHPGVISGGGSAYTTPYRSIILRMV